VTLLCERPEARAVAVDKSAAALEIAKFNAAKQSVTDRAVFVVSDCFDALDPRENQFDLIVSNPPYVSESHLAGLQREVRDHEPLVALSPGPDGLSVIRRLLTGAPAFLKPNGHLLMEIGFDQGEKVRNLVDQEVWSLLEVRPDLQCIPRIVVLQKR
jgi:release factor glutamine methyltransferase